MLKVCLPDVSQRNDFSFKSENIPAPGTGKFHRKQELLHPPDGTTTSTPLWVCFSDLRETGCPCAPPLHITCRPAAL